MLLSLDQNQSKTFKDAQDYASILRTHLVTKVFNNKCN